MPLKNIKAIEKIVQSLFPYLGLWHMRNLSGMVFALIHAHCPLVSEIARTFPYTKGYKSARKRVERFLRNKKCLLSLCHSQYLKWIIDLFPKKKHQMIIIDYTFLGRYMILWAALPFKGRAIPLYFRVIRNPLITQAKQKDVMIHLERDVLYFLRIHLSHDRKWVIVADRGFGNVRNMKMCQSIGFDYILRVKSDIEVTAEGGRGRRCTNRLIKNLPKAKWRQGVDFHRVIINLLSLTEGTDDSWYLVTSLSNPNTVQRLYEQRFWIEEMFRDMKTHKKLKKTLMRSLNVTKRLAFCLQLSYSIVFFIGIQARKSRIVQKHLLGSTKASFVFVAMEALRHLSEKFTVFLKKVVRNLRLGRAVLDTC